MRILLAIVEAVLSTKGVLGGCWGGPREPHDGMGEWTYSAHWLSRER
jgi:hypothetical protein